MTREAGTQKLRKSRKPLRRGALNRADIVSVALRIARKDGAAAVTMRKVAKALGAGTMSLYAHIEDRRDLVTAMLDRIADDIDVPAANADPRDEILKVAQALHHTLCNEDWAVDVIVLEGEGSMNVLPLIERILSALFKLGCAPEEARDRYLMLLQYIYGECLNHRTRDHRAETLVKRSEPLMHDYPTTASIMRLGAPDRDQSFRANVLRMLP